MHLQCSSETFQFSHPRVRKMREGCIENTLPLQCMNHRITQVAEKFQGGYWHIFCLSLCEETKHYLLQTAGGSN